MKFIELFLETPESLLIQSCSILLSFILGGILSALFQKHLHLKKGYINRLLKDSKFPFFTFVFFTQSLLLPVISIVFDASSGLIQLVLFAEGILIFSTAFKTFIKSPFIYYFGITIAWILFAFYAFDLLAPSIGYLNSVTIRIGTSTLTLLSIIKAVFATAFLIWAALTFSIYLERKIKNQKVIQPSVQLLVSKLLKTIFIICSIFIGLSLVGIDLSVFSIFAGAMGVGIAFSLQNILSNFFSGFIILMDHSIKPGDVISLDDGKTYGIVNKLHARYISLRTREGKEHLIPNQLVISNRLENWSFSDPYIRMEIPFRIAFDSDLLLVQKLLVEIAKQTSRVKKDPVPYIRFCTLIDNAVEIKLRLWIEDPENGVSGIQSDIIFEAWKAFREHDIRIPYPPREIYDGPIERIERQIK